MMIYAIGYGGRAPAELIELLRNHGVRTVVDVRLRPDRASMGCYALAKSPEKGIQGLLARAGIGYVGGVQLGNIFLNHDDWATRYEELLDKAGALPPAKPTRVEPRPRPGNSPQTPLVGEPASQVPPYPFLELLPLPRKPPHVPRTPEPLRPLDISPCNLYPKPISAALFTRQALQSSTAIHSEYATLVGKLPRATLATTRTLHCHCFTPQPLSRGERSPRMEAWGNLRSRFPQIPTHKFC